MSLQDSTRLLRNKSDFYPYFVRPMQRKSRFFLWLCGIFLAPNTLLAQPEKDVWELQHTAKTVSFRGVCAVSAQICWVSGSQGRVLLTKDGGNTWNDVGPPKCEKLDFRDIEAWDDQTAVIMSSGDEDRIYRTTNGGQSWDLVFEHPNQAAFFDGIAFADSQHGWLMGDPIDGQLLLLQTTDGGCTWTQLAQHQLPKLEEGEAGFAASGTNLAVVGKDGLAIALGGAPAGKEFSQSRIVVTHDRAKSWTPLSIPLLRSEAGGIFSLCVIDERHWVVVGGNYKQPESRDHTAAFTPDTGRTWTRLTDKSPSGYRSGVAVCRDRSGQPLLVTVGPSGTDLSRDFGHSWQRCSEQGYHTIDFTQDGATGWAAGSDGRIARWTENRN